MLGSLLLQPSRWWPLAALPGPLVPQPPLLLLVVVAPCSHWVCGWRNPPHPLPLPPLARPPQRHPLLAVRLLLAPWAPSSAGV